MINNVELFDLSIKEGEPYIDKYYEKKNNVIISDNPQKINKLMEANYKLTENISAYNIAITAKNKEMQETILKNIISVLRVSGINFSEFSSYWAVKDISYSVYKKTLSTDKLKIEFLKKIIPEFIKDRHLLYKIHGYSFSTLQVVNDSKAHKSNGNTGIGKVSTILDLFGFKHFDSKDFNLFEKADSIYIYPDKKDKTLFKTILEHYNIEFSWSVKHEGKQTDFLFKKYGKIFIMEHKHMKEPGGGQDKQMSEIIDFINYKDDEVHYVSFLDGVYFNLLADREIKKGKTYTQRCNIMENLTNNKQNYFVNTFGFYKLMESLKK